MPNAFKDVITQLQRQRAAIDRAIAALQDVGDDSFEQDQSPSRGQPAKKSSRKRTMSVEARKRIAEAQRKRWAAKKGAKKQPAKKAA